MDCMSSDALHSSENINHLCFNVNQNSAANTGVRQKRKSSPLGVKFRDTSLTGTGRCYVSGSV